MTQKILITVECGGFGKLTVKTLLDKGHHIGAAMREINGKNKDVANEMRKLIQK